MLNIETQKNYVKCNWNIHLSDCVLHPESIAIGPYRRGTERESTKMRIEVPSRGQLITKLEDLFITSSEEQITLFGR